jgi:hypothetical protein
LDWNKNEIEVYFLSHDSPLVMNLSWC